MLMDNFSITYVYQFYSLKNIRNFSMKRKLVTQLHNLESVRVILE